MVQAEKVGNKSRHGVSGRHKICSTEKDLSSIQYDRTQSSSTVHSQRIVSRKQFWFNLKKPCTRRYMCHLDHHRKFSYKDNWMCELDSDVAGSSKDTQRIQPKPQLSRTERPVCGQESTTEIEKRTEFDHDTLSQEKHDEVTDSTSTGRPVCGP